MTFWKAFFASLLAIIVSLGLFLILVFGMVAAFSEAPEGIKSNSFLHMTLNQKIGDVTYSYIDQNQFKVVEQLGIADILNAIDDAKTDDKVKGIYINLENPSIGMAMVKEIREAIEDFKTSGKPVIAYNESYSNKTYYLSSVATSLYLYPTGMLEFLGLGSEIPFIKGTLDKLGVEMQIIRGSNNKFKSAVEPLMYDQMSPANREQTEKYLNALWNEILIAVEKDRGISQAELNHIADSVLTRTPKAAHELKLTDGSKFYDEVEDEMRTIAGTLASDELNLFSFGKYVNNHKAHHRNANIAVISLEGDIVDGRGEPGQIGGNSSAELIRKIRKDSTIKAVVLRVNSPGGSALASDLIWREVQLTKLVKPVIVSMGNVAASGGYYVSCGADKIFAEQNTITGSIGVFGIIPFTGELMKNTFGVTFDRVQTNAHSVMSLNKKLTESELKIIQNGVDDIYQDFITKVAEGRGMTTAEIDSIGQGRVWAGTDAKEIGLIDEFGGLDAAIKEAGSRIGLTDDIKIKIFSTTKTDPMIETLKKFSESSVSHSIGIDDKLMELMHYIKFLDQAKGVQARIPYLFWIE